MRASRGEKHISGAERLLEYSLLEDATSVMLKRALNHVRGKAEKICFKLQPVPSRQVSKRNLLNLTTFEVADWPQGRALAAQLIGNLGVKSSIVQEAMAQLAGGPSPAGEAMRGAMLVSTETGQRLEPDKTRGVRVSRMDLDKDAGQRVEALLTDMGLNNPRVIEAWTLASKVALYPQVVAALCWSDDPDYITGYVASAQNGNQRVIRLKEAGSEIGGRIFFVRPGGDLNDLISHLQYEPVLFDAPSH